MTGLPAGRFQKTESDMARMSIWMAVVAVALVALVSSAARAQELEARAAQLAAEKADPDAVDPNIIKGEHWTLDIEYETPQPIVTLGPKGEKEVYWYVIYTITNSTGADRQYVPSFTLFANTGAIRKAGVYPAVFDAIKKARAAKYKVLENAVQMVAIENAKILVGPDNARTGVAIFAPLDRETRKFTLFIEGLSGEFVERPDRSKKVEPGHLAEGDKIVRLRKTLALYFDLPGDKWWLNLDAPVFLSKKWTWR
jgi:hypothetical protein